jgi:hypothetical protein
VRLIVVGAGLAGSWLTRVARDQGIEVTLIGDTCEPSTAAAVGLLRPTHLAPEDRPLLAKSLRAWADHGVAVHSGAQVTRWDKPGVKYQGDWYVVDPTRACLEPDVLGTAKPVGLDVVEVDGTAYEGHVVWCDGQGEGRRTYGVTWTHPDPRALPHPLAVHHLAPYKVVAAASFPTGCRLGSSSTGDPGSAAAAGLKLLSSAVMAGMINGTLDGWQPIRGTRLHREKTLTLDGPYGAYRWSGFHRTGFGRVPAAAPAVLKQVLT